MIRWLDSTVDYSKSTMESASSSGAGRLADDDVVVLSDSSSDSPPRRRRKRGRSGASDDPDYEPEAHCSSSGPNRRRTPKKGTDGSESATPSRMRAARAYTTGTSKDEGRSSDEDVADDELPTGWSTLSRKVLRRTFSFMENGDVISAGQCCRTWRAAAKARSLWRGRRLSYDLPAALNPRGDWHAGARQFARTIRFAPCLAHVSCAKSLKASARSAIATQSACEVMSAELNGQLQWTTKYIRRQQHTLRDLTLLNPTVDALQTALALPRLRSLAVSYERDTTKEKYQRRGSFFMGGSPPRYSVPAVPKSAKGTLQKLVCHPGVGSAAATSLVLANAATLEEVGVHCLPVAALQQCPRLERLMVKVNPAAATDGGQLRDLLKGRTLEYLAFIGSRGHAKAPCTTLRASLRDRVRRDIVCSPCDGVCALERPRFASRDVPEPQDDDGGEFDFLANMFRVSGPCMCICCAQADAEYDEQEGGSDGDDGYFF